MITFSLEDHSLSQKLSWLLSDKEHLLSCLEPWAFLCQENLAEATLVCLRAVEKNQPALLTEIDPSLVRIKKFKSFTYNVIKYYLHFFLFLKFYKFKSLFKQ